MTLLSHPRLSLVRVYLRQAGRSLLSALRVLVFGPRRSLADTVLMLTDTTLPPHPSTLCACSCGKEGALKDHDAACKWLAAMCRTCEGNGWCKACMGDGTRASSAAEPAPASKVPEIAVVVGAVAWTPLAGVAREGVKAQFTASVELSALDPTHRDFMAALSGAVAAQDTLRLVLRLRD